MDAFVDLDMDLAGLDTGFDDIGNLDGFSSSFGDFDSFLTSFDDFFSGDFGGFDNFFDIDDDPFPSGLPDPDGGFDADWMRFMFPLDGDDDGFIDQVISVGVRHNDNGTVSVLGFTFGGSHPNSANINFCTGIDVISTLAGLGSGAGALSNLGGFFGGEGLAIRFSSPAAGGGAGFAALFGGLFLGSAGHSCGSVGL